MHAESKRLLCITICRGWQGQFHFRTIQAGRVAPAQVAEPGQVQPWCLRVWVMYPTTRTLLHPGVAVCSCAVKGLSHRGRESYTF